MDSHKVITERRSADGRHACEYCNPTIRAFHHEQETEYYKGKTIGSVKGKKKGNDNSNNEQQRGTEYPLRHRESESQALHIIVIMYALGWGNSIIIAGRI